MFNLLKGKKEELTVAVDRENGIYYPGETVSVTVDLQPNKDMKVRSAQVKLSGTERYEYTTTTSSTDSDGSTSDTTSSAWGYTDLFVSEETFLGESVIPGDTPQRYTFQMHLPPDALPTCDGMLVKVYWRVSVNLDRPLAHDLNAEAEFRVHAPAPGLTQPGEYGVSSQPGEIELAFILPGLELVAGESFSGQLRILPRKNVTGKVRLELARHENVPYDEGRSRDANLSFDLADKTTFTAGQSHIVPFQIAVPSDVVPSVETPHGSIKWVVKGILSRGLLQKNIVIEQPIEVYLAKA